MNPWGHEPLNSDSQAQMNQHFTMEQFEQLQNQQQQLIQQQRQQLEQQQQQLQQQQHENLLLQQQHEQHLQSRQQQQAPSSTLENVIAMMAEGQKNLSDNMNRLLMRLENNPTQRSSTTASAKDQPPHTRQTQNLPSERPSYAPSSPSEGAYARDPSRRMIQHKEPKIRENLKFTGESRHLRQFLLDIYDILEQYSSEFANDKRRINWIASHFVSNTNDVSPAQAWFLPLLMKNAHAHGVVDPYANLKSLEYVLPALASTDSFIAELILIFGDKTSSRTAREDLSKCKQGNSSIVDYNSRYTSLALYVIQSDEDAIIKYVAGLNPEVRYAAIHVPGWTEAKTVVDKQVIAVQGQRIVDEVNAMGNKVKKNVYQHPNSNNPIPIPVQVVKPVPALSPSSSPMQVDAITTRNEKRNPFPAIRSICIQNSLCFRCLQPFEAKTHMVEGERRCPNKNASLSDKLALISNSKIDKKKPSDTKIHQIAALTIEYDTDELDARALGELQEDERDAVGWMVEEYLTGRSEYYYPATSDLIEPIEINSIRINADKSYPRRVVIPLTLKDVTISVQTMAFLDIGSMTNFVDDRFARKHNLKLSKKMIPLRTEAYNGEQGLDVLWEWNGEIEAVGLNGDTERFNICLNVTRLGKHEVMIGLPWMEGVG